MTAEETDDEQGWEDSNSGMSSQPRVLRSVPTAVDWENIKSVFTQLYVVENQPLRAVKYILADQYGFHATERMYKQRILNWDLRKNYKKQDKNAIIQDLKILLQYQDGKSVPDSVNLEDLQYQGRPLKMQVLTRHLKDVRKSRRQRSKPPEPDQRTAQRSPGPNRPIPEQVPRNDVELLLFHANRHMNQYVARHDEGGNLQVHVSTGLTQKLDSALLLESQGDLLAAFDMVNTALDDVRGLVVQQHPNIFIRIFDLFGAHKSGLMHSAQLLMAEMAEAVLGKQHPVSVSRTVIMRINDEDAKTFFWWCITQMMRDKLGPADTAADRACIWRISTLRRQERYQEALNDLDVMLGRGWIEVAQYLFWQGQILAGLRLYPRAETKLLAALHCQPQHGDTLKFTHDVTKELERIRQHESQVVTDNNVMIEDSLSTQKS